MRIQGVEMVGLPSLLDSALGWIKHDGSQAKKTFDRRSFLKIVKPASASGAKSERRAADLAEMVEAEIIPRLMLSHRPAQVAARERRNEEAVNGGTAESFARMVLSKDSDSLIEFVGTLLQSGIAMETIYVDLMMPAARLLGDYWDDDSVSFADVTIGLSRLQQVVRTLRWQTPQTDGPDHVSPSALFVPASSEQHTFGLFVIEDFFRRSGWRTWIETSGLEEDAIEMVQGHWFDLFGLSANSDTQIDKLASTISAVRKASRNPGLFILVGGRLFIERPELVSLVGADATAPDGGQALLVANKAVMRLASNG